MMIETIYCLTPIGNLKIEFNHEQLWSISLTKKILKVSRKKNKLFDETSKQLDEYFKGQRQQFNLPLAWHGTDFQIKVWQTLLKIPYGQTWSYQTVAKKINQARASRAVGNANKVNPFMIVVPCHRVIRANGTIGGYASGLKTKKFLLALEKENSQRLK